MTRAALTRWWRRLDADGLERLTITPDGDGWQAQGVILTSLEGGAAVEHRWALNADWSVRSVAVRALGAGEPRTCLLERAGDRCVSTGSTVRTSPARSNRISRSARCATPSRCAGWARPSR